MKVYLQPPVTPSRSLARVATALAAHAPADVEEVKDRDVADLVVLHVNGRQDRQYGLARHLLARGQRYAVVQYALKSTQRPAAASWRLLWEMAAVVWSYLDLDAALAAESEPALQNVYHAPLGVDRAVFSPSDTPSGDPFVIATSGLSWRTESVREAVLAAQRVGRTVFHLGPQVTQLPHVLCATDLLDRVLARYYSQCDYVSGLRRTEGFELPAAEGLLCGARPVLFDAPHYRQWYGDWAEYIPEGPRDTVVDALEALFRGERRPVSEKERAEAGKRFDWPVVTGGFWARCLS